MTSLLQQQEHGTRWIMIMMVSVAYDVVVAMHIIINNPHNNLLIKPLRFILMPNSKHIFLHGIKKPGCAGS